MDETLFAAVQAAQRDYNKALRRFQEVLLMFADSQSLRGWVDIHQNFQNTNIDAVVATARLNKERWSTEHG